MKIDEEVLKMLLGKISGLQAQVDMLNSALISIQNQKEKK